MYVTRILSKLSSPSNESVDYESLVPTFEKSTGISNNLFQICLRGRHESAEQVLEALPSSIISTIQGLKKNNPCWKYSLYGDFEAETFIRKEYGQKVLDYFLRINPKYGSSRADFLKSLLLYRYGGAYIDLKSSVSHCISDSINEDDSYIVMFWDNIPEGKHHYAIPSYIKEGEVLMGFIVASKGNSFSRAVIIETLKRIDSYNPYVDGVGFGGVMKSVGPAMYTEVIYRCMHSTDWPYRIGKPFSDFGYILSNGIYSPGDYQRKAQMTDYRKQTEPIIFNANWLMNIVNKYVLFWLSKR